MSSEERERSQEKRHKLSKKYGEDTKAIEDLILLVERGLSFRTRHAL